MYNSFKTLILNLPFTELRGVSIEHLERMLHASLPFRTPGSVPFLGHAYALIVETMFSKTCHGLIDVRASIIPQYFLSCASYIEWQCFHNRMKWYVFRNQLSLWNSFLPWQVTWNRFDCLDFRRNITILFMFLWFFRGSWMSTVEVICNYHNGIASWPFV